MNNWRLLLLAVVVVVQPIGSFTESNLINGRECCERSGDASIYGYRKTDERRSLQGIREKRHYETIRGPMLTRSVSTERSERRNSPELSRLTELRLTKEQEHRGPLARTRETREDQNRNRDELRHILGQNKRNPSESRNRDTLEATRAIRISRNARVTRSAERESRNIMSRLQIRKNRSIEENRLLPDRDMTIIKRKQEGIARRDTRLSERQGLPSIQLDNNRERQVLSRPTQDDGSEFRGSRFSDARFNRLRAAQTQRTVEQSESNDRDSRDVRVELGRYQRNTELRDRVSAVSRESEKTSGNRMRESMDENARLAQGKIDIRNNERNDKYKRQNDENRRSTDTRRNNEKRSLGSPQTRTSSSVDIALTRRNDEQMERRSPSMVRESIRLSRASERNTRSERTAKILVVRDETLDERRHERNNRISRDRTTESRRSRKDDTESSEELRRQREIKVIERSQESRSSATSRDVRESSEDPRQVNRLSKDMTISALRKVRDTERILESTRTVSTENPQEGILRNERENSRLSKSNTISILREVRDKTEQDLRNRDRESSELRQRVNNRLSNNRISMRREDHKAYGSTERTQESRRVVSPSRSDVNFRKIDFRNRQVDQDRERSDLRRQVLRRSITSARVTRSMSVERRNYARETFRASRSAEASRIREDTRLNERVERQQQHDQDRNIVQRVTDQVVTPQRLDSRISSRPESIRDERVVRNGGHDRTQSFLVQRVTRNVATPQRIDSGRSSRPENIRLERLVRSRAEIRENERRETQREERNDDRTRISTNHRSNERVSERRQNRESSIDSREVRMARNRDAVRSERTRSDRMQENRAAENSRIVRAARNLADVRSERVMAERKSENLSSQNGRRETRMDDRLDSRLQRDATRDSRETSSQRESRDAIERLNVRSRDSIALTEARNAREIRNNERHIRFDRNLNTEDARRESKSLRAIKYLTMESTENRIENGERKETRFVARDTLVQDSDEPVGNWQLVFYVLQGVYLGGLLMQMLTENENKSKKRTINWWSSSKNLIKVD